MCIIPQLMFTRLLEESEEYSERRLLSLDIQLRLSRERSPTSTRLLRLSSIMFQSSLLEVMEVNQSRHAKA